MEVEFSRWLGMGGVPPHDNPGAYVWERRLHWIMVAVALLAIPAFYLEMQRYDGPLTGVGLELDLFIFCAFSLETMWMLHICKHRWAYLKNNWLNVLIVIAAGAVATGCLRGAGSGPFARFSTLSAFRQGDSLRPCPGRCDSARGWQRILLVGADGAQF